MYQQVLAFLSKHLQTVMSLTTKIWSSNFLCHNYIWQDAAQTMEVFFFFLQKATPEDKQFSGHTAESIVAAMKMFNALGVKKKKEEKKEHSSYYDI